jgi:hypothetical protein
MNLEPSPRPSTKEVTPTQRSEDTAQAARETLTPPYSPRLESDAAAAAESEIKEGMPSQPLEHPERQGSSLDDRSEAHAAVTRATNHSDVLRQGMQGVWRSSLVRSGAGIILSAIGLAAVNVGSAALTSSASAFDLVVASSQVGASLLLFAFHAKCIVKAIDLVAFGWQNRATVSPEQLLVAHRARHLEHDYPKALDAFFAALKISPYGFIGARAGYGAFEIALKENDIGKRTAILHRFFAPDAETGEWSLISLPDTRLPNKIALGLLDAMERTRFDNDCFAEDFSSHKIISPKTIQCMASVFIFDAGVRSRVASGLENIVSGLGNRLPAESRELSKLALRLRTGIAPS